MIYEGSSFFVQPMEYHVLAHRLTFEVEDFSVLGVQSPLETNDVAFHSCYLFR